MKKIYESPQIVFEDMSLNSVIAACDLMEGSTAGTFVPSGGTEDEWLFFSIDPCNAGPIGSADDPFCYHSPDDADAWQVSSFS